MSIGDLLCSADTIAGLIPFKKSTFFNVHFFGHEKEYSLYFCENVEYGEPPLSQRVPVGGGERNPRGSGTTLRITRRVIAPIIA